MAGNLLKAESCATAGAAGGLAAALPAADMQHLCVTSPACCRVIQGCRCRPRAPAKLQVWSMPMRRLAEKRGHRGELLQAQGSS